MTNIVFEATGCVVAVFLTAAGLLLIGVIDAIGGVALHHGHKKEMNFYLFFAALAMGAGLFFWLSPWGSVQMLAVLAGLQGLIWGGWDLRFASHLHDHPRERRALRFLGVITLVLGAVLVVGMEFTDRSAMFLLSMYVTYIGIHILMIGVYIYHPWKNVLPRGKHIEPNPNTKLL
jgi:hypothetical protein